MSIESRVYRPVAGSAILNTAREQIAVWRKGAPQVDRHGLVITPNLPIITREDDMSGPSARVPYYRISQIFGDYGAAFQVWQTDAPVEVLRQCRHVDVVDDENTKIAAALEVIADSRTAINALTIAPAFEMDSYLRNYAKWLRREA